MNTPPEHPFDTKEDGTPTKKDKAWHQAPIISDLENHNMKEHAGWVRWNESTGPPYMPGYEPGTVYTPTDADVRARPVERSLSTPPSNSSEGFGRPQQSPSSSLSNSPNDFERRQQPPPSPLLHSSDKDVHSPAPNSPELDSSNEWMDLLSGNSFKSPNGANDVPPVKSSRPRSAPPRSPVVNSQELNSSNEWMGLLSGNSFKSSPENLSPVNTTPPIGSKRPRTRGQENSPPSSSFDPNLLTDDDFRSPSPSQNRSKRYRFTELNDVCI